MQTVPARPAVSLRCRHVLAAHRTSITAAAFSGNHQHLFTASSDRTVALFNAHNGTVVAHYHPSHSYDIAALALTPTNTHFATGSTDRTIILTATENDCAVRKWKGHDSKVNQLYMNSDNDSVLLSCSNDHTVRLWDMRAHTQSPIQTLSDSSDSVTGVSMIGDSVIVSASVDGCIRYYDVRRASLTVDHTGIGSHHQLASLTVSLKDSVLVSTLSSKLMLFDSADGSLLQSFADTHYVNQSLRLSPTLIANDRWIVSGCEWSDALCMWETESGASVRVSERVSGEAGEGTRIAVTFAYDSESSTLACGRSDGSVDFMEVALR